MSASLPLSNDNSATNLCCQNVVCDVVSQHKLQLCESPCTQIPDAEKTIFHDSILLYLQFSYLSPILAELVPQVLRITQMSGEKNKKRSHTHVANSTMYLKPADLLLP